MPEGSFEIPASELESKHLGESVMVGDIEGHNTIMGTLGSFTIGLRPPAANSVFGLDIRLRVGQIDLSLTGSSPIRFLDAAVKDKA
ncbi:hypothetical protein [Pseudarthrobacter sp. S9]|uniref:hypothetical protein n=1 Tax=Pseudarthrobacter sp. S9 TaxID=3418421 RepID=UPI003D02C3AB